MNPITPDPDAIGPEFPEPLQAAPDTTRDDTQETLDADDDDADFESDDEDSDDDAAIEDETDKD